MLVRTVEEQIMTTDPVAISTTLLGGDLQATGNLLTWQNRLVAEQMSE